MLIYKNLKVIIIFKGIKENCITNTPELINRGNILINYKKKAIRTQYGKISNYDIPWIKHSKKNLIKFR